ncbi:MAG: response regulator [candidate division Zixibacteria bacterium]|nr:response regulator [candidate division Zixibacteria bacterium]
MADQKKILVVDDEPDMVEWLTTFLEDNGFTAISAFSGAEGFAKAKSEHPDLITLDVSMADESGLKALRNFQETKETSGIPIIMVTGVSTDVKVFIKRNKHIMMPAGFMEKPVDRDELLKKVQELVK